MVRRRCDPDGTEMKFSDPEMERRTGLRSSHLLADTEEAAPHGMRLFVSRPSLALPEEGQTDRGNGIRDGNDRMAIGTSVCCRKDRIFEGIPPVNKDPG